MPVFPLRAALVSKALGVLGLLGVEVGSVDFAAAGGGAGAGAGALPVALVPVVVVVLAGVGVPAGLRTFMSGMSAVSCGGSRGATGYPVIGRADQRLRQDLHLLT